MPATTKNKTTSVSPKNIRVVQLILAVTSLGFKYQKINYYLYEHWYIIGWNPRPIWDLIRCTAYGGYVMVFLSRIVSLIGFKENSINKNVKFFNLFGIILYVISEILLCTHISSFMDIFGIIISLMLIVTITLEYFKQLN